MNRTLPLSSARRAKAFGACMPALLSAGSMLSRFRASIARMSAIMPCRLCGTAVRVYAWRRTWQRAVLIRSEEHTSELQSLMRISYAVFCLKKKTYEILYDMNNKVVIQYHRNLTCKIVTYE